MLINLNKTCPTATKYWFQEIFGKNKEFNIQSKNKHLHWHHDITFNAAVIPYLEPK